MTERKADVKGVAVAYTDRGSGAPALFLHGNHDSRHSREPLFRELWDGYRCIATDFPGFGDSQPLPHDIELGPAKMSEFWDHFVEAVVPGKLVHVVVHDFGGPWLLPWVAANQFVLSAHDYLLFWISWRINPEGI